MSDSEGVSKEEQVQKESKTFSEANELNHERNPVAKAQKQAASQETAGVWDQPADR